MRPFWTVAVPRRELKTETILFSLWLLLIGVALYLHPSPQLHGTHLQLGLPPCGFYAAFHKPCPTCGLTTSFSAMAHLQPCTAFRAHAIGPLLFLYIGILGVASGYSVITGRRIVGRLYWVQNAFIGVAVATVLFGVVRVFLS
jgi:hypothetical protein